MKYFIQIVLFFVIISGCSTDQNDSSTAAGDEVRDVSWFLERLRTVDHLPVLENSHTAMVSTWDTTGGNWDNYTHNWKIEGKTNTLIDIDGPGCIHRLFTGKIDDRFDSTRIQIYLDHNEKPLFDMYIKDFFDDRYSPFSYPLVFIKSYPGTLMPIPFEKNFTVKVVNNLYNTGEGVSGLEDGWTDWNHGLWGMYWQFVYTKYEDDVQVQSLSWPLNNDEQAELEKTCKAWLTAESSPPSVPEHWSMHEKATLGPGESIELKLKNGGVVEQMRISAWPDTPEVLNKLRLEMYWDGCALPSVDVPVGYMFGHGETGYNRSDSSIAAVMGKWPVIQNMRAFTQTEPQSYNTNYHSLLLGVTEDAAYCMFPMPYSNGAKVRLVNRGDETAENVEIRLDVEKMKEIPAAWGRFHITWSQALAATDSTPKFGPQNIPGQVFLERRGKGKYVGSMLQVDWPSQHWWGEGDFLFWTDEEGWPPSYHGTGSEEYFNSGWCMFDRKAVSGFVSVRPGYPTVYSFHLNDAFNFHENILVVEEQYKNGKSMSEFNPMWSSTAFWYSAIPTGAESMQ